MMEHLMKPKTELFLYQCMWVADGMFRPTWRNLSGSFEEWSYRKGFLRQIQTLEAQEWIESREADTGRVYRLTNKGLLKALGGRNPKECWNRGWDGKWRIVVFDLPERKRGLRNELRRQLRYAHFGCLQASVWVSPDPMEGICSGLRSTSPDCGVMTFLEAITCGGEKAADMVKSAWDFAKINRLYQSHGAHLEKLPTGKKGNIQEELLAWGTEEKALWQACMEADPLLPRELLPKDYHGVKVWQKRIAVLRKAGKLALTGFAKL